MLTVGLGRCCSWHLGCRFAPAQAHAWISVGGVRLDGDPCDTTPLFTTVRVDAKGLEHPMTSPTSPTTSFDAPVGGRLAAAVAAVPAALFHGEDGAAVRPCTPAAVTVRHLGLLDVYPGHRVLEVGTGSGWSAALLARLAAPGGQVTTLEIDPALANRARGLLAVHAPDAMPVHADALPGLPGRAPFDRILAGTTPAGLPAAWLDQLAAGGRLLTGVRVHELPHSYAVVLLVLDGRRQPASCTVLTGGYTPAHTSTAPAPAPGTDAVPGTGGYVPDPVDAAHLVRACHGPVHLLGADPALTSGDLLHDAATALAGTGPVGSPEPDEDRSGDLRCWLLADRAPEGTALVEADVVEDGREVAGLGLVDVDGCAAVLTTACLHTTRTRSAADTALRDLVAGWQDHGRPRTSSLAARLVPDGDRRQVRLERRLTTTR
jgi:protein-L-isoaspartate(D-aspartate) O-methyltransferase